MIFQINRYVGGQNKQSKAEVFYNGSLFITSKSCSKNLSNETKHTLGFQRIGILIYAVFVFITEIL